MSFFVFIAMFVSVYFLWADNRNFQNESRASTGTPILRMTIPTTNPILKIEASSQISPDGKKIVSMKRTHNTDGSFTYMFTVMDANGENDHIIYSTTSQNPDDYRIPFNAWSPDNRYVFIQKDIHDALVFKENGEPISGNLKFLAVAEIFGNKVKNMIPTQVTGWASPTLLIVNTVNTDGSKGYSHWFEVPSAAVIQLASQF